MLGLRLLRDFDSGERVACAADRLWLLALGKRAAIDMGIRVKAVDLHRASVRGKLGLLNDLNLHQLGLERGLL